MDTETHRTLTIAALMVVMVVAGIVLGNVDPQYTNTSYNTNVNPTSNYTAAELLDEKPFDQQVRLIGPVDTVLDDYTSDKGYVYQQFLVGTDATLKVFCSTEHGRINVSKGDQIAFPGTFQEFYGTLEVYGQCQNLEHI